MNSLGGHEQVMGPLHSAPAELPHLQSGNNNNTCSANSGLCEAS